MKYMQIIIASSNSFSNSFLVYSTMVRNGLRYVIDDDSFVYTRHAIVFVDDLEKTVARCGACANQLDIIYVDGICLSYSAVFSFIDEIIRTQSLFHWMDGNMRSCIWAQFHLICLLVGLPNCSLAIIYYSDSRAKICTIYSEHPMVPLLRY